jgi:hypothetical protein
VDRLWLWKLAHVYHSFVRFRVRRRFPEDFRRLGCVYIHIPRVAGTSIATAIFGREVVHWALRDYEATGVDLSEYWKFAVVRNPWDRLVSTFEYLKRGGMPKYPYDQDVGALIARRGFTFERFVKDWLPGREFSYIHLFPQVHFMGAGGKAIGVDFVGRYESLERDYSLIAERLGIESSLPRLNPSHRSRDYRQYYTAELVDLVQEVYADDIRLLEYRFE